MKSSSLVRLSMTVLIIALILILLSQVASAQPAEEWSKTYGGSKNEKAYSVRQTSDGGYIIAGSTYSFGAGKDDFYLVKTDSQGMKEWSKSYGGAYSDLALSVQQTSDSGYIIAGYTESFGAGDIDFYLVKTDSQGMEEWSRTYGGGVRSWAYSIQQTSDGGYIVAGTTYGPWPYRENLYLVKTDSQGGEKWSKIYTEYEFCSVQQTFDGGYIVAGYRGIVSYLTKVDSQGRIEWTTDYRKPYGRLLLKSIQQASDGGYILVGVKFK